MTAPQPEQRGDNDDIHAAAERGDEPTVRAALEQGVAVDSRDGKRRTPLHLAASLAVAKTLVQAGAAVSATDRHGNTALHLAASDAIVRWLLDNGAAIDELNGAASTPLHLAASRSRTVTRALLEARADVHVRNTAGETALHMAVDAATVALLADAGGDVGVAIPPVRVKALPARKFTQSRSHQQQLRRGRLLAESGQTDDAIQLLDALKEQLEVSNPLWLTCQRYAVFALQKVGKLAQSLVRLNEAIEALSDPSVLLERARLLLQLGRWVPFAEPQQRSRADLIVRVCSAQV